MKDKPIKKHVVRFDDMSDMPAPKPISKRVKAMSDAQIQNAAVNDSDAGSIAPEFWDDAKVNMPVEKVSVGIRLDNDVVEWFKNAGKGYQTRINAVLKSYMEAHK